MGCGCRKGGRSGNTPRPTTTARSVGGGLAAALTPTELRAQSQTPDLNPAGLDAERRRVQAARRDAIRRSLNK